MTQTATILSCTKSSISYLIDRKDSVLKTEIQRGDSKVALKAGAWYVISTFLIRALAFITTPIFTRIMSDTAYGEFTNFSSWRSTLLILTGFELYSTLSRGYYDYEDEYDKYISSVTVLSSLTAIVCYVLFLLSGSFIYKIVSIPPMFTHVMFATLLFASCKAIYLARERTLYRYKSVALISAIDVVIPTLISIVLVLVASDADKLAARVYGFYVPSAVVGAVCMAVLLVKGRSVKLSHCKYAIKLAFPLMLQYLTVYLLTNTNIIITKNSLGASAAAVVSVMTSVIHIMTLLFQSVNGAVTTWVMDNLKAEKTKTVRTGGIIFTLFLTAVTVGVILVAPEIVWIMGGQKYADATPLIPGMALSVLLQAIGSLFTIILTYEKKVGKVAIYTGVIAVVAIVAKILLIPHFGISSLPVINVLAFALLFAVQYILVCRAGRAREINLKVLMLLILGTLALVLVSPLLYKLTVLRYFVIALLVIGVLAVLYVKRDLIVKFLSKRKKK